MKIDTNMLWHLQGKPLIITAENWQAGSLNIEPQTFCGLMEIKEMVIVKNSIGTTNVIEIAKKIKNKKTV